MNLFTTSELTTPLEILLIENQMQLYQYSHHEPTYVYITGNVLKFRQPMSLTKIADQNQSDPKKGVV